jgi:very-short-patch-repair endonuclease
MRRWLQESDIEFIQQYSINLENSTCTHVDFYIPELNICLYCDGDYWHGPKRPDIQERDAKINRILEGMGYSIVRMTETEILDGNRPWWIGELISSKW